ncbi:MAG: 3-phosphoshikimate 1-carboxyvinyltransferase [Muribaculaceae bacterium]
MDIKITAPARAIAEVALPASKSISNRALILNALCTEKAQISNIAKCDDTDAMVAALQSTDNEINIGAAGTAMRFLTAYFATRQGRTVILDGSERMRQRPIGVLVDALRSCGAQIDYVGNEGFPPLRITGTRLCAKAVEIPGNVSSQYISALLMISPLIEGCATLRLSGNIISRPYIDMTLALMEQFGVKATLNNNEISIPQNATYSARNFVVENDWSAASYWFQMQALLPQSRISLKGLFANSLQGDSATQRLFAVFGVNANRCGAYLDLRTSPVEPDFIEMDLLGNPDLAQTIVVTACLLNRPFHITGLQTLKIKETDRIEALRSQLLKLGYVITVEPDYSLRWDGTTQAPTQHPSIATFKDHRMAMAFAPAAIKFPGIVIEDAAVVSKSYPDYWQHLAQSGFKIEEA